MSIYWPIDYATRKLNQEEVICMDKNHYHRIETISKTAANQRFEAKLASRIAAADSSPATSVPG